MFHISLSYLYYMNELVHYINIKKILLVRYLGRRSNKMLIFKILNIDYVTFAIFVGYTIHAYLSILEKVLDRYFSHS